MEDLSGLRWLAEEVAPDLAEATRSLPSPLLLSRHVPLFREYIASWIINPDPAGTFAARTRLIRRLPPPISVRILLALGYDGLIYPGETGVVGHSFFQRHGTSLHGFSGGLTEELIGRGYGAIMVLDFVAYAARTPGILKARVGRGENKLTRRVLTLLTEHSERLEWQITPDAWVIFHRGA
jgi:hypothetical protein